MGDHAVQLVFHYRGHQRSVKVAFSDKAPAKADWVRIASKAWGGVLGDSFDLRVDGTPSFVLTTEEECKRVWEMAGVSRAGPCCRGAKTSLTQTMQYVVFRVVLSKEARHVARKRMSASSAAAAPAGGPAPKPSVARRDFRLGKPSRTSSYGDRIQIAIDVPTGKLFDFLGVNLPGPSGEPAEAAAQTLRCKTAVVAAHKTLQRIRRLRSRHIARPEGMQWVPNATADTSTLGTVCFFLEHLPGGTLSSYCETFGTLHPSLAVAHLRRTVSALGVLHQAGMAHGSVDGSSLLIDRGGKTRLDCLPMARIAMDQIILPLAVPLGMQHRSALDCLGTANVALLMLTGRDILAESVLQAQEQVSKVIGLETHVESSPPAHDVTGSSCPDSPDASRRWHNLIAESSLPVCTQAILSRVFPPNGSSDLVRRLHQLPPRVLVETFDAALEVIDQVPATIEKCAQETGIPDLEPFVSLLISLSNASDGDISCALRHQFLTLREADTPAVEAGMLFLPDPLAVRWKCHTVGQSSLLSYRIDRGAPTSPTTAVHSRSVPRSWVSIRHAMEHSNEQSSRLFTVDQWWESLHRRPKLDTEEEEISGGQSSSSSSSPSQQALRYDPRAIDEMIGAVAVLLEGCNEATVDDSDDESFASSPTHVDKGGTTSSERTPTVRESSIAHLRPPGLGLGALGIATGAAPAFHGQANLYDAPTPKVPAAVVAAPSNGASRRSMGLQLGLKLELPQGPPGMPGGQLTAIDPGEFDNFDEPDDDVVVPLGEVSAPGGTRVWGQIVDIAHLQRQTTVDKQLAALSLTLNDETGFALRRMVSASHPPQRAPSLSVDPAGDSAKDMRKLGHRALSGRGLSLGVSPALPAARRLDLPKGKSDGQRAVPMVGPHASSGDSGRDLSDSEGDEPEWDLALTVSQGWEMFNPQEESNAAFGDSIKEGNSASLKATDLDQHGHTRALRLFMGMAGDKAQDFRPGPHKRRATPALPMMRASSSPKTSMHAT
jgi:serine/threonine protein kinase